MSYQNQWSKSAVSDVVRQLRDTAIDSLARMYCLDRGLFAFTLRKRGREEVPEGVSRRYTATVLIALAGEDPQIAAEVLGGHSPEDVCTPLLEELDDAKDLGEVALTAWAARALGHSKASMAMQALRRMEPGRRPYPTVELSWALTAMVIGDGGTADIDQALPTARALLAGFHADSGIFRHGSAQSRIRGLRAHVSCFADFVYPIHALSCYYLAMKDTRAVEVAARCAERMCELQGPQGQWWWHFDVRTGRVIEHYPVYAVHQDAMAPMALFALAEACGRDHSASIEKGLQWLVNPPENAGSLIDTERKVIWRKVARREPRRLVRGLQAAASRLHPRLRLPAVDAFFPPVAIDYESRPYHMAWILHAWPAGHAVRIHEESSRLAIV
jgi:hypothetical protein